MWYLPLDFGAISMEQTSQFSGEREKERESLSITFIGNRYDT